MQNRRILFTAGTLCTLLLGACAEHAPTLPADAAGVPLASSASELQDVARVLALGLAHQDARVDVRASMRRSRLNEHKLVLQSWAHTPEAQRVIAAAARAAGTDAPALLRRIDALPIADFYAPFREHRTRWQGTGSILVAATMDPDAPAVTAYAADGTSREFRLADGVPAQPMLMLHPAERKGVRPLFVGATTADVIQDMGEADGVTVTYSSACAPDVLICPPGDEEEDPCYYDPSLPQCQYVPPTPPSGIFMEGFNMTGDGDTEWGDEEYEFRSTLRHATPPGSSDPSYVEDTHTLRYEGVNTGDSFAKYWNKFDRIFSQRITDSSRWLVIRLYESDPWPNTDDDFGQNIWYYSDFVNGNGLVNKAWTQPVPCGYQQTCESVRVSADIRVTPWP